MPDDPPEEPSESEASLTELITAMYDEEAPFDEGDASHEDHWRTFIAEDPNAEPGPLPPPSELPDDIAALLAAFSLGEGSAAPVNAPDPPAEA